MIGEWLPLETLNQSFIHLLRLANSWQDTETACGTGPNYCGSVTAPPPPPTPPPMTDTPPHQRLRHLLFANMVWVL